MKTTFEKYMITSTSGKHLDKPCCKCGKTALSLHVTGDGDFYCRRCKDNIEAPEGHHPTA